MIAPDAELRVKELIAAKNGDAADSQEDSYESMLALAAQAAGGEGAPEKNLPENVRLFQLQVVRTAEDGTEQEITSRVPVTIEIAPGDMKADSTKADASVVRFATENDVLQAVKVEEISVSDKISFTQDQGAGTYGVFYNGGAKPAFHEIKEVDGIRISVQAEEGVFPEGATLSVTKIEAPDAASGAASAQDGTDAQQVLDEVEKAVSSVRGKNRNVALSQTFDIKVLSRSGVEIQPTDAAKVKVSFTMAAVENKNLDMQVYHLAEPQKQSGTESADTVEQSADENPEASAEPAESANEDAEETESENAESEAAEVQTEQDAAADVPAEEGIYRAESLEVVTDGSTATVETESFSLYTVEFTYGELVYVMKGGTKLPLRTILDTLGLVGTPTAVETSNRALLSASNKSGEWIVTSYQAFSTEEWMKVTIDGIVYEIVVTDSIIKTGDSENFIKDMKIPSLTLDYAKLSGLPDQYRKSGATTWSDYRSNSPGAVSGEAFRIDGATSGWLRDSFRTSDNGSGIDWPALYTNRHGDGYSDSYTVRYVGAAADADGNLKNVLVTFSNISLDLEDTTNTQSSTYNGRPTVFNLTNGPRLYAASYAAFSYAHGVNVKVTYEIEDADDGDTYFLSLSGIDKNRNGDSKYTSIKNASSNNNFSDSVTFVGHNEDIYVPSSSKLIDAGANTLVAGSTATATKDDYDYGFVTLAGNQPLEMNATFAGKGQTEQNSIYFFSAVPTHSITAATGTNGTIDLWDDGIAYANDSDAPAGVSKIMDGVTRESGPKTFSIPNGKSVTYKMSPIGTSKFQNLTVDGASVAPTAHDASGNVVAMDSNDIAYYTYTFEGDNTDHDLFVQWKFNVPECDDCKNIEACENCYLAIGGGALNDYQMLADGVFMGGDADSLSSSGDSSANDTFANPLPHGTVFIDTSYLKWNNANKENFEIDIQDPRFKFVGSGANASAYNSSVADTSIAGHPFDAELVASVGNNRNTVDPSIAYYGLVHSYLNYGAETNDNLGYYARTNTAPGTIANGTYTAGGD
ncbi:MAG: hypothetical protein J6I56_05910, partial [Lachnospiraceae bacterium]|nr:hypothetical protein [Lachnospiraceae bacterium]